MLCPQCKHLRDVMSSFCARARVECGCLHFPVQTSACGRAIGELYVIVVVVVVVVGVVVFADASKYTVYKYTRMLYVCAA